MANFVIQGLPRGPRNTSTARRAIMGAFRDASKILAALLLLSINPAFAIQRGGGGGGHSGGGGGGHFSGGGGHVSSGASHAPSGGQHAAAPHPSGHTGSAPAPHSGATAVGTGHPTGMGTGPGTSGAGAPSRAPQPTHVAQPGYVWEATPGYSNRVGPATPKDLGKRGFLWEETPSTRTSTEKSSYFLTSNLLPRADATPRQVARGTFLARGSVTPRSGTVMVNRRPIPSASLGSRPTRIIRGRSRFRSNPIFFGGFFPFGFFPGFFFDNCFAFGADFAFAEGFGGPCGYGYNMYPGYGYYLGGNFSDYTVMGGTVDGGSEPTESAPSADEATAPPGAPAPTPGADTTVLYLKDGTSFGVVDYWLEGGRLHYVTTYGGANAMALDELDLQRTVDENSNQGIDFTLRPPHWEDPEAQPQSDEQPEAKPQE